MDVKDFVSGSYKQQYQYKSFAPNHTNIDWQIKVIFNNSSRFSEFGKSFTSADFSPALDTKDFFRGIQH